MEEDWNNSEAERERERGRSGGGGGGGGGRGALRLLKRASVEGLRVELVASSSSPSSSGDSSTSPSPRNAAAFGVVDLPGGGKGLLIHGGWDPFRKTHDDTWLLTEEKEE